MVGVQLFTSFNLLSWIVFLSALQVYLVPYKKKGLKCQFCVFYIFLIFLIYPFLEILSRIYPEFVPFKKISFFLYPKNVQFYLYRMCPELFMSGIGPEIYIKFIVPLLKHKDN